MPGDREQGIGNRGQVTGNREQARRELRVYMSRSGLGLRAIADRTGFAHRSLIQFVSAARYGVGEGAVTAAALTDWMHGNPLPEPELPGRLYATAATREMDELLGDIRDGGWGILYGPSGSQKTFFLEYRAAESPQDIIYIRASAAGMRPGTLLRRISAWIGAPYAQSIDAMRQNILFEARRRRSPLALVIDESDHLYSWVETLETLREIGDLARRKIGILIAGNEKVEQIFENRRSCYLEKWRARIQQSSCRVQGATMDEAAEIFTAEVGRAKAGDIRDALAGCRVADPRAAEPYVNMHRLFNTIREIKRARAKAGSNVAAMRQEPLGRVV